MSFLIRPIRVFASAAVFGAFLAIAMGVSENALAQNNNNNNGGFSNAVGGVMIDADGMLRFISPEDVNQLALDRQLAVGQANADLNAPSENRKISLKGLEKALAEAKRTGAQLPIEVLRLAGLQRIRQVFVYPEQQDIVLVGYGEGWKVDNRGNVVGVTTGRPVLLLEDLLVALRGAAQAAQGGIWCSIDPTKEGLQQLRSFTAKGLPTTPSSELMSNLEQALGSQTISVGGVPATSHFAHILVAADYRMKRLAMNFDPSPVKGLPSYMELLPASGRGMKNMMPRWWLAADYKPLLVDKDGLSFELQGQGVKAMTEEDALNADGTIEHTGKASPAAKKWADAMTAKYEELSLKEPIFGELRNMMDLAVVSALIVKEGLATKAGLDMPMLTDGESLPAVRFEVPKLVDSKASLINKRGKYLITVSGGVKLESWQIADKQVVSDLAPAREQATAGRNAAWWWN